MTVIRKTNFNFSRYPGQPLPDDKVMRLIHAQGPEWQNRDVAVEALATFIAESRLVQRAYLARVELPDGEFFLVERLPGKDDRTTLRSKGYQRIRDITAEWPSQTSLSTARSKFRKLGCEIVSADRSIPQNNSDYDPVPDKVAFTLEHAMKRAYNTFVSWDSTFNAWYANVDGHHVKNLPRARMSWARCFG